MGDGRLLGPDLPLPLDLSDGLLELPLLLPQSSFLIQSSLASGPYGLGVAQRLVLPLELLEKLALLRLSSVSHGFATLLQLEFPEGPKLLNFLFHPQVCVVAGGILLGLPLSLPLCSRDLKEQVGGLFFLLANLLDPVESVLLVEGAEESRLILPRANHGIAIDNHI